MNTAEQYRQFSDVEVRGYSPAYENLAGQVASDSELLALIDQLPALKRQPNLLLAAVRFLGGPINGYPAFREWTIRHWPRVRDTMLRRFTQTNETGRCAAMLPLLAALPQPLALIEVGASAGLCLYPDRYRYAYDDRPVLGPEDSPVHLTCRTSGPVPFPADVPEVVWRTGVDLTPLSVEDLDAMRWLEALVWPGQEERLNRLRAAIQVAREDPPELVRGDLGEVVTDLIDQVPAGVTPVVFHSAVLVYLSPQAREDFAKTMRESSARWISNEAPSVLPSVQQRLPRPAPKDRSVFILALDEHPVAFAGPHGQSLEWLAD